MTISKKKKMIKFHKNSIHNLVLELIILKNYLNLNKKINFYKNLIQLLKNKSLN